MTIQADESAISFRSQLIRKLVSVIVSACVFKVPSNGTGEENTMSDEGGSGLIGFAIFIGILLVVNALSYFLNWGFWLY